jgi:hypothetical protein
MNTPAHILGSLALVASASACVEQAPSPTENQAALNAQSLSVVPRADFNRLAAELALPIFWRADDNNDGRLDPSEAAAYWGANGGDWNEWLGADELKPKFLAAYASIAARLKGGRSGPADSAETRRQELLRQELAQGRFTLLMSDLSKATPEDKAFVSHIVKAAELIDDLYLEQSGTLEMRTKIPETDTMSRMVFFINHGPWCSAPRTEGDKDCSALKSRPAPITGLYPLDLQAQDKDFCKTIAARPDAAQLMSPFTVVVKNAAGELAPAPYTEVYKTEMQAIAKVLEAAAAIYPAGQEEALKTYLRAAAQAFLDNQWPKADEAWSKMNAENSKWYLRVAPDETYSDPCQQKAGFQTSFALINADSLKWQKQLDPVKNDMEAVLAAHAGKPYKARQVAFHLPDFIDILLNSGDARSPRGATIGESLPNWGPVANEGRGRTVVMTNFYTDLDSRAAKRAQVESLLCMGSMGPVKGNVEPELMSTVLHEAAHNLGPAHEYKVNGKTDDQIFGGPLAATMEELKAQTAALYLADWLAAKKVVNPELVRVAHTYDITWAFGHIADGMYTAEGLPKTYSQIASVQVGYLIDKGAIVWKSDEPAANSEDRGCFELKLDRFPNVIDQMTTDVFGIKARGDVKAANAIKEKYIDAAGNWETLRTVIAERWLRSPRASFVYAVKL